MTNSAADPGHLVGGVFIVVENIVPKGSAFRV